MCSFKYDGALIIQDLNRLVVYGLADPQHCGIKIELANLLLSPLAETYQFLVAGKNVSVDFIAIFAWKPIEGQYLDCIPPAPNYARSIEG